MPSSFSRRRSPPIPGSRAPGPIRGGGRAAQAEREWIVPRDGFLTLSAVRSPTQSMACEPCGRRGTYNVGRLMEQHAKLTDLLKALANCPKARLRFS
jgi:hypothetical protein